MRLYVAGQSPKSLRACVDLLTLCEEHLADRCRVEIIDLIEHPSLAQRDDVLAIPTLVVDVHEETAVVPGDSFAVRPGLVNSRRLPTRRLVGDLSQMDNVLAVLGLPVVDNVTRTVGSAV
jgi:circadian clock protein KaiB